MISNLYGFPIYKVRVSDKSLMMKEVNANIHKVGDLSVWDANCLTTCTRDSDDAFKSDYVKHVATKHANEMMKELELNLDLTLKICETKNCMTCDDIWMNIYNKGHSQEMHSHLLGIPERREPLFSFSYFAKYDPEIDAKFVFINHTIPRIDCKELYKLRSFLPETQIDVEEGDILIFPSFLLHRVEEQKSDHQRITISGNFYEQVKEN